MKKIFNWISLIALFLIVPSMAWAQGIPTPYIISGTVTMNDAAPSAEVAATITVRVLKGGNPLDPVAEDTEIVLDGGSYYYSISVPIYDASTQDGGAAPGDSLVIQVLEGSTELNVTTPTDGAFEQGTAGAFNTSLNVDVTIPTYTLTVSVAGGGTAIPATGQTYNEGTVVDISAIPNTGWTFTSWSSGVASSSSATTTVTMDADKTITATFSCSKTLTMAITTEGEASETGGSVSPAAGTSDQTCDSDVTITATATSGYAFDAWTGAGVTALNTATTTVSMTEARSVTANFTLCNYTLTVAVNDAQMGSTTPTPGESTQSCDAVVDLTATAESGYSFVNWTGDVADANSATTTVTVDATQTVTANFTAVIYTLTMEESVNGSTLPAAGDHSYGENANAEIIATPATGYIFGSWTGDDIADTSLATTTILMDADKTVSATFEECFYTLTMAANDAQMGSVTPETGSQSCDSSVSITATAAEHYSFVSWTGAGVADLNAATTTVSMTEARSVTATFTAITHDLTMVADDNGTTTPVAGISERAEPAVVTITATPGDGYAFSHWTGDVVNAYRATTTVTMDEDQTVTPIFLANSDDDDVPDSEEHGSDGTNTTYDGDGDGTVDSTQANVTSFHNTDRTLYVTIAADTTNSITSAPAVDNPDTVTVPEDVDFDFGFYQIDLGGLTAGGSSTVTIYLPEDGEDANTYYKYGPTADDATDHWYEFKYDSASGTGAEFDGNVVTLHFVDGARGDSDLDATNGIINDPGAPGIAPVAAVAGESDDYCFIATAAYGSKMEPQVEILRNFRDKYLMKNKFGKAFVNTYYKYSPSMADVIAKHDSLRASVRLGLTPLIAASWLSLNFGLWLPITMMAFLLIMFIGGVKFHNIRRKR